MQNRCVVLLNLGTPSAPTPAAVRAFLEEFLLDPAVVDLPRWFWAPFLRRVILPRRAVRSAGLYRSIWSEQGAPLDVGTRRMTAALAARLGGGWTVVHAHRYGAPSLPAAFARAVASGCGRVVVAPLFPQRTRSTTGGMIAFAERCAREVGLTGRMVAATPAPDAPGYISALAARVGEACAGAPRPPEHLLVSFHGTPTRCDRREGGLYRADCAATTRALLAAAGWPEAQATLAYQSRFGPEPWLAPATLDMLRELPRKGVKRVAVVTPGFLTEGLETLEEIGVRGRAAFLDAGGEDFERVRAVEDHPAMIEALAGLVAAAA